MPRKRIGSIVIMLFLLTCMARLSPAESAVVTVLNAGTTQALTKEDVSVDDMDIILRAGLVATSAS